MAASERSLGEQAVSMSGTPRPRELDFVCPKEGPIRLLIAYPEPDAPWGGFTSFQNTPWAILIREVTNEAMSHAYHGWFDPLLAELGSSPHAIAKRIPQKEAACANPCPNWSAANCRAGGIGSRKKDPLGPPDCFTSGSANGESLALAVREGRHPVVVIGTGFNLA